MKKGWWSTNKASASTNTSGVRLARMSTSGGARTGTSGDRPARMSAGVPGKPPPPISCFEDPSPPSHYPNHLAKHTSHTYWDGAAVVRFKRSPRRSGGDWRGAQGGGWQRRFVDTIYTPSQPQKMHDTSIDMPLSSWGCREWKGREWIFLLNNNTMYVWILYMLTSSEDNHGGKGGEGQWGQQQMDVAGERPNIDYVIYRQSWNSTKGSELNLETTKGSELDLGTSENPVTTGKMNTAGFAPHHKNYELCVPVPMAGCLGVWARCGKSRPGGYLWSALLCRPSHAPSSL